MKRILLVLALTIAGINLKAQSKYLTKNGHISFFSSTVLEDIEAHNRQVVSIVDTKTGEVAVSVLMKAFEFEKSLMQEHFNENYVESDKYPKAIFRGRIIDLPSFNDQDDFPKELPVSGELNIHGVKKDVDTVVQLVELDSALHVIGKFDIEIADYDIEIPSVVAKNIAETVEIKFDLKHDLYQ